MNWNVFWGSFLGIFAGNFLWEMLDREDEEQCGD